MGFFPETPYSLDFAPSAAIEKPSAASVTLWLEMGRLYFLTEKPEQAAREFSKVVLALEKPDDYGLDAGARKALLHKADATYQLLGETFLEAGRPADAAAAFEKSNQFKADDATFAFNLARVAHKQKNAEAAYNIPLRIVAQPDGKGISIMAQTCSVCWRSDKLRLSLVVLSC